MPGAVLLIGGSGTFGSRLAEGLAATTDLALVVAGRDGAKARETAAQLQRRFPGRAITGIALDRAAVTAAALSALGAGLLVDAAGPFQFTDLALPRAAIAAGIPYLDLADATGFVSSIEQLDGAAKRAGVAVVAGASSTPALSAAVVDDLTLGWQRLDTVEVAISPGNRAPRGLSVVRAILSYVGRPVRVLVDGQWASRPGFSMLARRRIGPLGARWLALCDAPDLVLLPRRAAPRRSAIFRAGLELPILHLGLYALGLLVRARLLRALTPLARPLHWCADRLLAFGTDRGGMVVEVKGLDAAGRRCRRRWILWAEAGQGLYVPTLPALALIRSIAAGRGPAPGAVPCVGLLPLATIAAEFDRHRITTQTDGETDDSPPLFAGAVGPGFAHLPAPIRTLHSPGWWAAFRGRGRVDGAANPLGRLVARLFGFPPTLADVPVRVTIARDGRGERWRRDFGGHLFSSHLRPDGGGGVVECFGPFHFPLRLTPTPGGLRYDIAGWRLGRLPLPGFLEPRIAVEETIDAQGRFHFDVALSLPLVGRMVRYRGWLEADEAGPAPFSPHS
ncbi:DUF4166 domain-containing protein [Oleomonas cavernae]|uniref:DUF4166 domain-containing protein n=1 Tax=Oleomonas cavernae TaxID=2320859 RepID=A0A418WFT3_9PROT|nr:SDR family oxidoreductase [Oleomonas cavernae]RJF88883.1 DUF4166 domain-containing protein [Oleomonas cavernae]